MTISTKISVFPERICDCSAPELCCRHAVLPAGTADSDCSCSPLADTAVQRAVTRRFPFREKVRGKMMGFLGGTSIAVTGNTN